ncbi:hypothetical protein [Haloferula sp. A504]|uniref:hypothetical protein n=1 Tax=Haloferula sp. A504 TaxID=3373601 RepID=UPI0031BC4E84|nr:hypothetical protein [Verrucomicrobiaceae bacterium E54]
MKYKIIPLILFAALTTLANAASETKSVGSFIETTGEYEWSNSERIVLIEQNNDRLQFSISLDDPERKKSIGPKAGLLQPGKPWMFWIESRNKIWMFDGDSRLWEYTFRTIEPNKYQDSISEIKDSDSIPSELLSALPAEFIQSLKKI